MMFTRYLLKNFLKLFALMQFSWVFVFVAIDFVGNIRMWLLRDWDDVLQYYWNYLPHIVYLIMPVAVMLSALASVGGMAKHLELSAMVGAGRSMARILFPLLVVGLLISGGSFALQEYVLPDANHARLELAQPNNTRNKQKREKDKSRYIFIGEEGQTLYFRHYSARNTTGRDVIIITRRDGRVYLRIDAEKLIWKQRKDGKGSWTAYRGDFRQFFPSGSVSTIPFSRKSLNDIIQIHPDDLLNTRYTADEMNISQIRERISLLKRTGEETAPMLTQLHFKYSGPLINFFILVIGASLSHRYSRSGGLSRQFGIGLFVIFIYYVGIRLGLQMGEGKVVSPWLGAWLGNLVFGVVSVVLFLRSLRL